MKNDHDRHIILVVDDVPANIDVLSKTLSSEYLVKAATSGKKAFEIAETQPRPDLILLDIMMPEMDGYEVCRQLKSNKSTKDIPVIFVTALDEVEDEQKGLELGAVDYITKPVSPPIVRARVRNHLMLKTQHDQLKTQHDQLKESISIMQHEAEILQQKAELGIQAGGLAHDINNILAGCMIAEFIPEFLPENFPNKESVLRDVDLIIDNIHLGTEVCKGYTSYLHDIGSKAETQPVLPLLQPLEMYSREFRGVITKEFAKDLPQIYCKGYQVKRVLVNLFTNACQAVKKQSEQEIIVKVWHANGHVYFSVQDNGPGIPEDVLPNIFKELFTTKEKGTGLGLFMAKQIIDDHKGDIKVDTREGSGTIFTFSLPAADENL